MNELDEIIGESLKNSVNDIFYPSEELLFSRISAAVQADAHLAKQKQAKKAFHNKIYYGAVAVVIIAIACSLPISSASAVKVRFESIFWRQNIIAGKTALGYDTRKTDNKNTIIRGNDQNFILSH